jgi:hypothetical protein
MICIGKYQAHIGIKYVYDAILEKFGVAGFLRCILISNILISNKFFFYNLRGMNISHEYFTTHEK